MAGAHNVYARYNQFNGDPVTGLNIRAFNFGYFRSIGQLSRLSFDYQFVDNPAYNADRGPAHIFAGRLHAEF